MKRTSRAKEHLLEPHGAQFNRGANLSKFTGAIDADGWAFVRVVAIEDAADVTGVTIGGATNEIDCDGCCCCCDEDEEMECVENDVLVDEVDVVVDVVEV